MRMAAAYVARRRRLPWLYETVRQIGRRSPCPSGRPPGAPRLRREREYQYRNPPAPSHDFRILTIRKLAEKLAKEDIEAEHLVDLWDRAFVPASYPLATGELTQVDLPRDSCFPDRRQAPVDIAASADVPQQLPAAICGFAGRSIELHKLTAWLDDIASAGTMVISAVDGMPGIGKTALAVHWAHQVADRFPDGQLYINLRGFDPSGVPVPAVEAIRGFLDAFGIPASQIPRSLDAQAGLYRSLLAGRRVLGVLDNARDVEQVRPLLPGSPGCLALVTSRSHLTGLVAGEGAYPLALDHYLHTARNAVILIEPHFEPPAVMIAQPGVSAGEPGTAEDAMSWFGAEHAVLLAAVQLAADAGHGGHAWQLAWMLSPSFLRRGSWTDHARAQHAALAAARRTGDTAGEAHALHALALGHARSGRFHDAYPHFQHALRQFEATGDHVSQARIHDSLAWLSERAQRPA